MASQEIESLASALARLPGLGPRSARRVVLWLVKRRETALVQLLDELGPDPATRAPVLQNLATVVRRSPLNFMPTPRARASAS